MPEKTVATASLVKPEGEHQGLKRGRPQREKTLAAMKLSTKRRGESFQNSSRGGTKRRTGAIHRTLGVEASLVKKSTS